MQLWSTLSEILRAHCVPASQYSATDFFCPDFKSDNTKIFIEDLV